MGIIGFSYVPPVRSGTPTHCELTFEGKVYTVKMDTIYEMSQIMFSFPVPVRQFLVQWCERLKCPD
jgi:hypothetical protein